MRKRIVTLMLAALMTLSSAGLAFASENAESADSTESVEESTETEASEDG